MAKTIRDTDYLAISARIRAMETELLTGERMEQILTARGEEEVSRVLQDCGYPGLAGLGQTEMDAALTAVRRDMLADLGEGVPDAGLIDVFKLKYDYHNLKALLKAEAVGTDPASMLSDMGRVEAATLRDALSTGDYGALPPMLAEAAAEAKAVLETTRDPQLSDILLDRWAFREELALAEESGSELLAEYVRTRIDGANLRALVRTLRMGKDGDFLKGVLTEGGDISPEVLLAVAADRGRGLAELYAPTGFAAAAEAGEKALKGGPLTEFERLCDDAAAQVLDSAAMVPFGDAPLIAYLAARETEYTNLRILLLGRRAGLPADVIRARLRKSLG